VSTRLLSALQLFGDHAPVVNRPLLQQTNGGHVRQRLAEERVRVVERACPSREQVQHTDAEPNIHGVGTRPRRVGVAQIGGFRPSSTATPAHRGPDISPSRRS
jgi:hypothetical protein